MKIEDDGSLTVKAPKGISKKEIEKIVGKYEGKLLSKKEYADKKRALTDASDEGELSARLQEILPQLLEKYTAEMGVSPAKVTITKAKKRFGSCSQKKHVCFSLYLALFPKEAIEYVVVHELAHLTEFNHSKAFYAIIEKHLPDWKERRSMLDYNKIYSFT